MQRLFFYVNEIDGRKVLVDYEEDAFTEKARNNLRTINQCFIDIG